VVAALEVGPRAALLLLLLVFASCDAGEGSGGLALEEALRADWGDLEVQIVTTMPDDQRGGRAIVFLHGYGSKGANYTLLAREILDDDSRIFLPTAVLPHPSGQGSMWWEFLEEDWPKPYSDDPSANAWPEPSLQLPKARESVEQLLAGIRARYQPDNVVIAGHSQGAMLALDVGAAADPAVDGIAAVAGYVLLDSVPRIAAPREDRPTVFIAHGRNDEIVGFEAAGRMKRLLEENGFVVVFRPHAGDHGIDAAVVRDLRDFLDGLQDRSKPEVASGSG
jgi:predicted esterase